MKDRHMLVVLHLLYVPVLPALRHIILVIKRFRHDWLSLEHRLISCNRGRVSHTRTAPNLLNPDSQTIIAISWEYLA